MASRNLVMLLLAALLALARSDVYLHSPRGQNDRCDEKSNNRNNERRCFNSQNNAAGGYSTCDKEMVFYTDTVMNIEWYSQHNCGNGARSKTDPSNPEGVHCQHILQLGCDFGFSKFADEAAYTLTDGKSLGRPGVDAANKVTNPDDVFNTFGNTCTQTRPLATTCAEGTHNSATCATLDLRQGVTVFNSNACSCSPRKMQTYCYHEPEAYWLKCQARERNKGLFTADQAVRNNGGASATRQNPNTDRYGFECSEERDYWPYWHPTPYIDLAVFTSDTSKCDYYLANTQNTVNKCECVTALANPTANQKRAAMVFNQEATCTKAGHKWTCWSQWNYPAPECLLAPFQPDNALGRVTARGDNPDDLDGSSLASYQWTIPESLIPAGQDQARCFIRLRYNISNANVPDGYNVADNTKLENDPVYTFGSGNERDSVDKTMPLRLAIDTAQYGRTFQDRSYTFTIKRRPADLVGKTIHNLNVRGKRGNIAQVRNCFEYDFVPLVLDAKMGDLVHFQWCLSDYNDNGNAGEGRAGTDRVNVVPISAYDLNTFPSLNATTSIFAAADLAQLAWLGQKPQYCYSTPEMLTTQKNNGQGPKSCHFLNGVRDASGLPTAYFSYMATVTGSGTLQFMSSRNNNFSNRSQKATINVGVGAGLSNGAIAGIAVGAGAGVAAIGGAGVFMFKKKSLLSFSSRV